tara:strand:- start:54 stop:365 length:312 start_codon:yes stop_codon:yes gene_type:complete
MAIPKIQAILSLTPDAEFILKGDELTWFSDDITEPTESEITAEQTRLQAEYDAKDYARSRALAYPSLSEFVEAYTEKEILGDSTKWDAYVLKYNQVRSDNPKP